MRVGSSALSRLLVGLAAAAIVGASVVAASAQKFERRPASPRAAVGHPAAKQAVRPGLRTMPGPVSRPAGLRPAAGAPGRAGVTSGPSRSALPNRSVLPQRSALPHGGALPGRAATVGPRGPGAAGLRQPGANLRGPGLRQSPLARPGMMAPGMRSGGRSPGSMAWATMRQRYYVPPPRSPGPPPGMGFGRTQHEMRFSGVPPRGEVRFVPREVVVQVANTVPRAQVDTVARQLGISVVATQSFDAAGRTLYHFRAADGRDVGDVVRQLEQNRVVASAQPNYVYRLDQGMPPAAPALPPLPNAPPAAGPGSAPASSAATQSLPVGDPTQYVIQKLQLAAVHRQTLGRNVSIAVIDSEIDLRHPDIQAAIKEHFDPTGVGGPPDLHGTGMAGAIAAKYRLLGIAPEASILAIKAFDLKNASAEATSFQILKGLDYAIQRGVRIINMSFAGPYDLMLERKLQEAYDKGIVLVAAAGNAGPKSPPLYPAADPNVIAVTATDLADKPFAMANRGNYIAIAAPGVDILAPAPAAKYQLTTGTSVAAAHVSGVIALLLEKRPELTPDDVRVILAHTGKPIAAAAEGQAGAGLIDPLKALSYEVPAAEAVPTARAPQSVPSAQASQPASAAQGAQPAGQAVR
jgi:subtilisin family serine protease